ncbi:hypothetical protein SESBI_41185 [Sesbania bispinosa]|nr:hypothetical protein SESBI_41185 [Sesbania bispinosa]
MALSNHDNNVWKALILDVKNRKCFFNADEDKKLAKAILDAKKEMDQSVDLLDANSVLFRNAGWKVESRYIICSIEIIKESRKYIQVLKIWDILPLEDIPQLAKRLDNTCRRYTDEYIFRCKQKGFEG